MSAIKSKCWTMFSAGKPSDKNLLRLDTREIPTVGAKQVLVKVIAAALNPVDFKICEGFVSVVASPPLVPGFDFAGIVEEAGSQSGFAKGQRVYGDVPNSKRSNPVGGSLSEFILVPADLLSIQPESLSAEEAASLPLVSVTALDCLTAISGVPSGAKILILGASGGVGTAAIQLCKAKGYFVIGVCSGKNKELVLRLGADNVIDYTVESWDEKLKDDKVEVVFDFAPSGPWSSKNWYKAKEVLKPKGRFISISGDDSEGKFSLGGVLHLLWSLAWRNIASGFKYSLVMKAASSSKLKEISKFVESGQLKPIVEKVYPFDEVHSAFERLMSGRTAGKVVVALP